MFSFSSGKNVGGLAENLDARGTPTPGGRHGGYQ